MENDTSEIDGDDVSKETTSNTAWFEDYSYTSGLSERMRLLFLSKVPIMMITTDEEDRTLLRLKSIWTRINKSWFAEVDAKDSKVTEEDKKVGPLTQMTVYNSVLGPRSIEEAVSGMQMRPLLEIKPADITEQLTLAYQWVPHKFSAKLRHLPTPRHYFVFQDSDAWMSGQSTDHIRRFLVEFAYQTRQNPNNSKTIILLSRTGYIHPSLSRYIEVVNDMTASDEELTRMLEGFKKRPVLSRNKIEFEPDTIQSLRGLTHYESKSALDHATVLAANRGQTTTIADPKTGETREAPLCQVRSSDILDFKRNQLRQSNLLTFIESDDSFDQLGGLGRFKEWAEEQKHTWTPEGRAYGLKPPRGVLNVGVWGCGKSHSVKALGRMWGLPVIQLEIGKLRDSAVGGSEANVYQVTRMIDSMGPCVTGDTQVTLADGSLQTIESLWQDTPDNLEVMCWNERTLKVDTTSVSAVTRREAEAYCVSAANGFELKATANHQHYVLRGGMPEWVRTDELESGDMLAVPLKKYDGDSDCTRFHPEGMRLEGGEYRRGKNGYHAAVSKLPDTWSTDLGWLLGSLESDGYIGKTSSIGYTNTQDCLLSNFERAMESLFGLKPVRNFHKVTSLPDLPGLSENPVFQPCWTTKVQNQLAADFLRKARNAILTAPAPVRAAYLAGWLDGDGCFQPGKVVLTVRDPVKGPKRRILARAALQSLGVVPSRFDARHMEVTGSRAVTFAKEVSEYLIRKQEAAHVVRSSDLGWDRGMGFKCGRLVAEARAKSGVKIVPIQESGISTSVLWRHENGITPVSERQMGKYLETFKGSTEELETLVSAECRWVEINSVLSVGVQPVYDLVCEGKNTHSFMANGIITHNCILWADEAEKSFAGSASSGVTEGGILTRMIGILSTWIQESKSPFCFALTANSVRQLPVEFINRLTERFFFDLPTAEERMPVISILLKRAGQDPNRFANLPALAAVSEGMVPREIEQAIEAANVKSFVAKKPCLDEALLKAELMSKPRITTTMTEELKELREWVGRDARSGDGIRARLASLPKAANGFQAL